MVASLKRPARFNAVYLFFPSEVPEVNSPFRESAANVSILFFDF